MELQIDSHDCDLCEKFSEIDYVPIILGCGHSICSSCLQEVFNLKKMCPECDCDNRFRKFSADQAVHIKFKTSKKIVEDSLSNLKNSRKIGNENYDKDVVEGNIEKLEEILKSYQILGDLYYKETNDVLGDYYKNDNNFYYMVDPKPTKYVQLDGFQNRTYFMHELNHLIKEEETVYVCDVICKLDSENRHFYQWKYGKFNSTKDCLDIHCLSISSVDENTACVGLQDLKSCLGFSKYRPFIDFGSGKLLFTPTNSSNLALQFVKLCTGENGPMLNGSTATFYCGKDDTAEEIDIQSENGNELDDADLSFCYFEWVTTGYRNVIDFNLSDHFNDDGTLFSKDDVIIQSHQNRIYVRKVIDESYLYKNVVAKLVTNSDLKDLSSLFDSKIKDCGISMDWIA